MGGASITRPIKNLFNDTGCNRSYPIGWRGARFSDEAAHTIALDRSRKDAVGQLDELCLRVAHTLEKTRVLEKA